MCTLATTPRQLQSALPSVAVRPSLCAAGASHSAAEGRLQCKLKVSFKTLKSMISFETRRVVSWISALHHGWNLPSRPNGTNYYVLLLQQTNSSQARMQDLQSHFDTNFRHVSVLQSWSQVCNLHWSGLCMRRLRGQNNNRSFSLILLCTEIHIINFRIPGWEVISATGLKHTAFQYQL